MHDATAGTTSKTHDRMSIPTLVEAEQAGWEELEELVEQLTPEQALISGYHPGWSVKDLLAHLAGWLAEAGAALERARSETFTDSNVDVDARNEAFIGANRDQPLSVVLAEVTAARRRMLGHLHGLSAVPATAEASVHKAGPEHYAEHLPRLRQWVAQLRSDPFGGGVITHELSSRTNEEATAWRTKRVIEQINELAHEEHQIFERESGGRATALERERLKQIEITLDQCWDLLRQRQARRSAGLNPDETHVRDTRTVEGYVG
jgi:Protein of unknown function (DUF2630)/Mycothiol maleylpyruvate isomerase N-terminal domain